MIDGHALLPTYRPLPAGDPASALVGLLADLVAEGGLRNFVPPTTRVTSEAENESDRTMQVGLSDDFWALPEGERYAAAAQIVYTLATIEEGKRLLLLDGTVPGQLHDGDGQPLGLPLTRASFSELEPWIQLVQPVAGATVSGSFPLRIITRDALPATAEVETSHGSRTIELVDGSGRINLPPGASGDMTLRVIVRDRGGPHTVEVPLRSAGRPDSSP
ncbi:MAG TPA: GerMN domain-containing protein [Actinomycetota bacterium]|nr:GerMN domain-containing protein [Actinomycetota bacterium]